MITYQDIVDYLDEDYDGWYKVSSNEPPYITISNGYDKINIYKDRYNSSLDINSKLNRLLADLLDTPVDQRNKPEIKHTIKPVTKRNLANYMIKCLDSADKIIGKINSFILKDFSINTGRTLLLLTTFNSSELLQVLSLFKDFDITIKDTKEIVYPKGYAYTLSIKAK